MMKYAAILILALARGSDVREVRDLAYVDGPDADPVKHKLDLYLPKDAKNVPVLMWIHGGGWKTGDRSWYRELGLRFAESGVGFAAISYRLSPKVKHPAHVEDCARAFAWLRGHVSEYGGDPERLFAVGQSAGGHLALWLAARPRLPADSPLRTANPLPIAEVVSLGGLPDLEETARSENGCGNEVIARLTNGHFADTSVPRLAPLGLPQVLINGLQDRIIPIPYAEGYARPMRAAGDDVRVRMLDHTGHVELVAPETAAWAAAVEELQRALGVQR